MRISDWSSDVCSSDLVGLQGVAGNAGAVDLGAALGVALRGGGCRHLEHRGKAGDRQQPDHVRSPVSLTRMTPIMPAAWCSRMWQGNIQSPGLAAAKAVPTRPPGATSTVSRPSPRPETTR